MMVEGSERQTEQQTVQATATDVKIPTSDDAKPNQKQHHHRKRKRHIFNSIRQQMEFYFSDANLAKDRFLKQLVEKDPFVPLSIFMTFNKIKKLASSAEEIEKALDNSEMLELSCDRASVRRITDILIKENVDEYTIYVESLPPTATIETIKCIFKQFGNVAYVSLPKYRRSGKIKEFAFVEFDDKQSVDRCLSAFKEFDGIIDINNCHVEQLGSVKAYIKEQDELDAQLPSSAKEEQNMQTNEKKLSNENQPNTESDGKEVGACEQIPTTDQKRKFEDESNDNNCVKDVKGNVVVNEGNDHSTDCSDVDSIYSNVSIAAKRQKINNESDPTDAKIIDEQSTSGGRIETVETEQVDEPEDGTNMQNVEDTEDCDFQDESNKSDSKRRKRRRRKEKSAEILPPIGSNNVPEEKPQSLADLRITTKGDWKRLRNKYLTFQRQQFSQVKREIIQKQHKSGARILPRPVVIKNKQSFQPQSNQVTSAKVIRSNARNMNFYGANNGATRNADVDENTNAGGNNEKNLAANASQSLDDGSDASVDSTNASKAVANAPHLVKKPLFQFEPGIIVKVHFDYPCVSVADFKAEMKQYSCVRYVDLREGQTSAYVRVDNPRSAPTIIKQCAPNRCQILTGEPEMAYWNKINLDREQKLNKTVRVTQRRGRNKLITAANCILNSTSGKVATTANMHIRFDD